MNAPKIDGRTLDIVIRDRHYTITTLAQKLDVEPEVLRCHMKSGAAPMPQELLTRICAILVIDETLLYPDAVTNDDLRHHMMDSVNTCAVRVKIGTMDPTELGNLAAKVAPYMMTKKQRGIQNSPIKSADEDYFFWTAEETTLAQQKEQVRTTVRDSIELFEDWTEALYDDAKERGEPLDYTVVGTTLKAKWEDRVAFLFRLAKDGRYTEEQLQSELDRNKEEIDDYLNWADDDDEDDTDG